MVAHRSAVRRRGIAGTTDEQREDREHREVSQDREPPRKLEGIRHEVMPRGDLTAVTPNRSPGSPAPLGFEPILRHGTGSSIRRNRTLQSSSILLL